MLNSEYQDKGFQDVADNSAEILISSQGMKMGEVFDFL